MKRIFFSLIGAIILLVFGCQKDPYPYISLKDTQKIDSAVHPKITNAAFIYKNNIYYVADFDLPVTQITSDGSAMRFVKMSHDHTKFAYLNSSSNIVVVDNNGKNITTLYQYTQVKSFDWSANDKTLYILNGNSMSYYGPVMNLPGITYPGITNGSTLAVLSASVSLQGDFAYVVHGYNFIDGDKYELIIKPANNGAIIEYDNPEDDVYTMGYVNFSTNKQDLVVGYKDSTIPSDILNSVRVFTGLKSYPDFSFGDVCTPTYNSNLKYMVAGRSGDIGNTTLVPTAIYLGDGPVYPNTNIALTKILSKYSVTGSNFYTDWK